MSNKWSQLSTTSAFTSDDYLMKVKRLGNGAVLVTLKNFISAINQGYILQLNTGSNAAPADATTYTWGTQVSLTNGLVTGNVGAVRTYIPKAGHITQIYGNIICPTVQGTSELGTIYARINDTTDYLVTASASFTATINQFSATGLRIAVNAGDFIGGKLITPTWVTNPNPVQIYMSVFISL